MEIFLNHVEPFWVSWLTVQLLTKQKSDSFCHEDTRNLLLSFTVIKLNKASYNVTTIKRESEDFLGCIQTVNQLDIVDTNI